MPQLSADLLKAVYAAFNTRFLNGMQRGRPVIAGESMAKYLVKLSEISMNVPSTTEMEIQLWISQIPGFVEWVGDRVAKTLLEDGLKVVNRDFHETIKIPRNKVLDGTYGQYSTVAENMGAESADDAFWLDLVIEALTSTDTWADDLAFFSDARVFGGNTINNVIDGSLTQANLKTAVNRMMTFKGSEDKTLNVVPYMALCGVSAFWTAKRFLENDRIVGDAGGDVDNETQGILTPRWHPGLYDDAWYILGMKSSFLPLCAQRRQEATALQTLVNPSDPNVFWNKEFVYGTDLRGEGFRPFPFLIVRGSAGTPPAAPAAPAAKKAAPAKDK